MSLINGTFITQPKFSSLEAIKLINKFKITSLYLVPTLFHELIEDKSFTNNKVKSCKKLGFAGAPMNNGLIKKVMKAFKPIQLVNHYGSSEVYTFTIDQNADKKPGSAGKAGINQRIRIVEIGSNNPQKIVKKNIEGEIIASLKSEESFSGYLKRPDANKKSIIKNWYFTNDIGFIDNNGDLFVTGRVDDMIITGGENVSPIEIENLLSLNKNVLEVVVVGLPDEKWGQRICGFIKRDGNIEFGNLDKHCKESGMANFKRPKEYIFVKEIPKSPTGKILRRKLLAGEYDLDR
jgi:2-furoate---CoA ligase